MKLRSVATICLVSCTVLQQTAIAASIDCDNQEQHYLYWTQEHFELAEAVFFGKIIAEKTPIPRAQRASAPPDGSSMSDLLELIEAGQASSPQPELLQAAVFKVEKSWKGPAGPTLEIKASLYVDDTGHHAVLKVGDSYLVFAFKSDNQDFLHVPLGCTSHEAANDTASKIRVLDALTKKPEDS